MEVCGDISICKLGLLICWAGGIRSKVVGTVWSQVHPVVRQLMFASGTCSKAVWVRDVWKSSVRPWICTLSRQTKQVCFADRLVGASNLGRMIIFKKLLKIWCLNSALRSYLLG